jgi:hypothetical protein
MVSARWLGVLAMLGFAGCAEGSPPVESESDNFDSAAGNPTHPTHSSMAELAIKALRREAPEVADFEEQIVEGANLELHDLPTKTDEALRIEIGGNNWAAEHPEILWDKARDRYRAGDKAAAYRLVGIMLHYVQDMGSPAHAFHVIHQSGPKDWDRFEMLAFFKFQADMDAKPIADPRFASPAEYIEWSAKTAREHFKAEYAGQTYHRLFFPQTNDEMTDRDWAFMRQREADCVWGTTYALHAAAKSFAKTR